MATVPDHELRLSLGVKPGHKVCLFHAPKHLLPLFLTGDLRLTLDWVESDSDVIAYWLQPEEDAADIMTNLERMIKRSGRIWLILPNKESAQQDGCAGDGEDIRHSVQEVTSLVDTKTLYLSQTEYGILFMARKAAKEAAKAEGVAGFSE